MNIKVNVKSCFRKAVLKLPEIKWVFVLIAWSCDDSIRDYDSREIMGHNGAVYFSCAKWLNGEIEVRMWQNVVNPLHDLVFWGHCLVFGMAQGSWSKTVRLAHFAIILLVELVYYTYYKSIRHSSFQGFQTFLSNLSICSLVPFFKKPKG